MTTLQLQNNDARIAYLAVVYHLGRPGSEIDPESLGVHRAALQPLLEVLRPQLEQAVVTVEANAGQVQRIGQALSGVSNELRQYGLSGSSMVAGFSETVVGFWPEVAADQGAAADLVQFAVMLRRRLESEITSAVAELAADAAAVEAERQARRGAWWQVWRR
ncbi:MAG: hypothetical protein HOH95_05220 [Dehalococcoidia bacterium]|nr:hypothetical protein [Dehalococcoidia bacterium]